MKLRNKKTGEIIDLAKRGLLKSDNDNHIIVYPEGTLKYYAYDSLSELNEDWEDYKLAEPLIKDEKIRKAVRAWAEALGTDEVRYNSCAEYSEGRFEAEMGMADIDFGRVLDLKDDNYTIAELCGEDKE